MKSFKQFIEDTEFALTNIILESKGFGQFVKQRKRKKKLDKDAEAESKRTKKVKKLVSRTGGRKELWKGLT